MFYRIASLKIKDKDLRLCGKDESKICNCCGTQSCSFRQAARKLTAIDPNFLYVIVSGLHGDTSNENGDYFEWDKNHFDWEKEVFGYEGELLNKRNGSYVYETWRGKPNLVNHDERTVVGHIEDVFHIPEEKSVDKLLAVNRQTHPLLVRDIENEITTEVSMGTLVASSICSKCKHIAHDESEWCTDLKFHKGKKDEEGNNIYEINKGVVGQECSWITMGSAADPKATKKKVIAEKEEEMVTKINPIAGKRAADAGGSGAGAASFAAPGGIKNAIAYESDMSSFTGISKEKGTTGLSPEMQTKLAFLEKIPVDKLIGLVDDKTVKEIMAQMGTSVEPKVGDKTDGDILVEEIEKIERSVEKKPEIVVSNVQDEIATRKTALTDLYKKEEKMKGTNAARRISAEIVRIEDEIKELEKQEPVLATKEDSMDGTELVKLIKDTIKAEMKSLKAQFGEEEKDKDKDLEKLPETPIDKPSAKEEKEDKVEDKKELPEKVKDEVQTPTNELKKDLEEGANVEPGKAKEIVQDIKEIVKEEVKKVEEKEMPKEEEVEEIEEPLADKDLDLDFIEAKRKSESKWIVKAKKKPVFSVNLKQAFDTDSWNKNWKFFSSKEYGMELRKAIKTKGINRTIAEEFAEVTRLGQVELPPETPAIQTATPQAVLPPQSQQRILEGPKAKGSFVKFLTNMTAPLIALDTPVFDVDSVTTELQSTFSDEAATNQFKGELEAKVQSLKAPEAEAAPGTLSQPITVAKSVKALKKALFEEFQKAKPAISEDEVWLIYSAGDEVFKRELLKGRERTAALSSELKTIQSELDKEIRAHKRTQASLSTLLEERSLRFKARKAVELVDKEMLAGLVDTKESLMAKGEKDEKAAEKTAREIYEHEVDELVAMDDKAFNNFTKKVEAILKETKMTRRASIGKVIASIGVATTDDEPTASIESGKSTTLDEVWSKPPKVDENEK